VIGALPEGGSGIWVTSVEVNISADPEDEDVLTFAAGELGVTLVRRFANRIFNTEVTRRFDGATAAWESRFVGLADTLQVRATGDSLWRVATAARAAEFSADVVEAARLLFAAGVPIEDGSSDAIDSTLDAAGMGPPYADDFLTSLVSLNQLLLSRRHVVAVDSLSGDTQYEYEARSTGLAGSTSNSLTGFFRTRLAPDLRPAAATDLDVQTTTMASASWFTNRPADTRLLIEDAEGNEVASVILDAEGALVHAATIGDLTPDTEYTYVVTSRLIDVDDLIAQGLLSEEDATIVKTSTFRTRASREPLRLLAPPARVVSPETAVIHFRLNQIALATVAYGEVSAGSPDSAGSALYEFFTSTGDILNEHSITLSDLTPSTQYRYRVVVVTPDGDSLSTDPRGNQQWSQDLMLTTSAAGDTLPPVIVEGPFVIVRDVLGVVRFVTGVDTRATVFFGTAGGTYGTADEFEVPDQTPDGSLRLSHEHSITISGLEREASTITASSSRRPTGRQPASNPTCPPASGRARGSGSRSCSPPGAPARSRPTPTPICSSPSSSRDRRCRRRRTTRPSSSGGRTSRPTPTCSSVPKRWARREPTPASAARATRSSCRTSTLGLPTSSRSAPPTWPATAPQRATKGRSRRTRKSLTLPPRSPATRR
jgi:hypothetical protein